MKVLVINGSPHIHGCTDRALREVEITLRACLIINVTVRAVIRRADFCL